MTIGTWVCIHGNAPRSSAALLRALPGAFGGCMCGTTYIHVTQSQSSGCRVYTITCALLSCQSRHREADTPLMRTVFAQEFSLVLAWSKHNQAENVFFQVLQLDGSKIKAIYSSLNNAELHHEIMVCKLTSCYTKREYTVICVNITDVHWVRMNVNRSNKTVIIKWSASSKKFDVRSTLFDNFTCKHQASIMGIRRSACICLFFEIFALAECFILLFRCVCVTSCLLCAEFRLIWCVVLGHLAEIEALRICYGRVLDCQSCNRHVHGSRASGSTHIRIGLERNVTFSEQSSSWQRRPSSLLMGHSGLRGLKTVPAILGQKNK